MSKERTLDAESRIEHGSKRARRASTAAAKRTRETPEVMQGSGGRVRERIVKQTSTGVEPGRLEREPLNRQPQIARREPAMGRIVSILHARLERPIPVEPELAHEPSTLAEAHTHLEELSEWLAAGSPPDHRN